MTDVFSTLESNVRSYCRKFPAVFANAKNALLYDEQGHEYIDFFCGAGALNYGHNNEIIKASLINYLNGDGITHGLDLHTAAKREFIRRFDEMILQPRGYRYKLQFPGPTGTNAVEAALKLARKGTGRSTVVAFTNAFHGMTLGSLAATARMRTDGASRPARADIVRMPYDGFLGRNVDSINYIESMLFKRGCGVDKPAAFIVETIQAEGGVNVASNEWLSGLSRLAKTHGVLLIVDDVQAGCGRTGTFFSFERAEIEPDVICLSKSIGGYGLPMALVLMQPALDIWEPGEHNGTFRGNNLAFVAAAEALNFWASDDFRQNAEQATELLTNGLNAIVRWRPEAGAEVRGLGLLQGLAWQDSKIAQDVSAKLFEMNVVAELCGPDSRVLKVMPPLTIELGTLSEGLRRLATAVQRVIGLRESTLEPSRLQLSTVAP